MHHNSARLASFQHPYLHATCATLPGLIGHASAVPRWTLQSILSHAPNAIARSAIPTVAAPSPPRSVVFFQFSRIKMLSQTGTAFFTKEQHQWVEMNRILSRLRPEVRGGAGRGRDGWGSTGRCDGIRRNTARPAARRPQGKPRPRSRFGRLCARISSWRYFEAFVMTLILLNVILMAAEYYDQPRAKTVVDNYANYVLTFLFAAEVVVRVSGSRSREEQPHVERPMRCIAMGAPNPHQRDA